MDHDLYKVLATGRKATTEGSYLDKKWTAAVKEVLAFLGDRGSKKTTGRRSRQWQLQLLYHTSERGRNRGCNSPELE